MLREQALGEMHRPLVVMTPKSMLRSKAAVSQPEDFTSGAWHPVLPDPSIEDPSKVTTVLLCSGKVRWDLVARRRADGKEQTVAIVPLERLYPLPAAELAEELDKYRNATEIRWVQEEPCNQGAWPFMALNLEAALASVDAPLQHPLVPITRPASSAPSVGSAKVHESQQKALTEAALS
jgi:2-oxoglutarate dehydrogenase E1 component